MFFWEENFAPWKLTKQALQLLFRTFQPKMTLKKDHLMHSALNRNLPYPLVPCRLMIHKNDQQTKPYNFWLRLFNLKWLWKKTHLMHCALNTNLPYPLVPCRLMIHKMISKPSPTIFVSDFSTFGFLRFCNRPQGLNFLVEL